jgi:serine/threonine protein kinase
MGLERPNDGGETLSPAEWRQVDEICNAFETAWKSARTQKQRPQIEQYLADAPEPLRVKLLWELLEIDVAYRQRQRERPKLEDYLQRFPTIFQAVIRPGWLSDALSANATPHGEASSESEVRTGPHLQVPTVEEPARTSAEEWPVVPGYEVLDRLKGGGMGVVYKARQTSLQRTVALKMIRDAELAGPEQRSRFRREAEAMASLRHAHIVQIYDIGEHKGRLYFAMEYAEGGNLEMKLADQPLPAAQAVDYMETLAEAVQYAHQHNIIHRDLKPANVLLTVDGRLLVTDFGLAKRLDNPSSWSTQSGAIMGTASYMAPEQAAGRNKEVGPAADVYSLGAILYKLLTGRPPFVGETFLDTLDQVRNDEPVPPSSLRAEVPEDLEAVCLKCLAKEAGQRYASAAALAEDLRRFRRGEAVEARVQANGPTSQDGQLPSAAHSPSEWNDLAPIGRLFIPGYEILGRLGRGHMSIVYKARDLNLQRFVALRVVEPWHRSHAAGTLAEENSEFILTAKAVAQLQHPNIVQVYEVGQKEGRPYLVMEYMESGSLAQRMARTSSEWQEGTAEEEHQRWTARSMAQVAQALHYAHTKGIIHRDLTPANVLFTADGTPKITDFGLAKIIDQDLQQTLAGAFVGTPTYMAPEMAKGNWKAIGPATDVYALGAILYELLTGEPPFKGTTLLEVVYRAASAEVIPPSQRRPGVPRDLETICLSCLRKDPAQRYPSAEQLACDLLRFLNGEPVPPRPIIEAAVVHKAHAENRQRTAESVPPQPDAATVQLHKAHAENWERTRPLSLWKRILQWVKR